MNLSKDVTLQINASPGDIAYAGITIPALVKQHADIENKLLIVDCCRPQTTKIFDADKKVPLAIFNEKVIRIKQIAANLLASKIVTDVFYLEPYSALFDSLSKKYLKGLYKNTHSSGGTANMSYWAGIDIPQTQYVLHYDCDIILYQDKEYKWVDEALQYFDRDPKIVMAVPRLCPPLQNPDMPSRKEGRPIITFLEYWINDWFSTRHFLLDKSRLEKTLPLVRGRLLFELLIRKYAKRAFPLDPEIILFKSLGSRGFKRLILKNNRSWIIHPLEKPVAFLEILPQIVDCVEKGYYPPEQAGLENIQLKAWLSYFAK